MFTFSGKSGQFLNNDSDPGIFLGK